MGVSPRGWRRWLPGSLFARLLGLLMVMALLGHALALGVVLEWLGPPRPPPPGMGPLPDGAHPPPGWGWGMLADIGVRLLAMAVAAWWGARCRFARPPSMRCRLPTGSPPPTRRESSTAT